MSNVEHVRMTRIAIDPRAWSSIRALCIENGIEVPELLGAIVKQSLEDLPRLNRLIRKIVQEANQR